MPIQLNAKPDADFTNPLGLLQDCHRRIERFLDVLVRIAETSHGGPLEADDRERLAKAQRYFRSAGPMHTSDEEESLFPRLRASESPEAPQALQVIAELEADHDTAEKMHEEIDRYATAWLSDGKLPSHEAAQLLARLLLLRALYRGHIAREDGEVFPLAGRALTAEEIRLVGREMAVRRGLDPDNLPFVNRCTSRRLELDTIGRSEDARQPALQPR